MYVYKLADYLYDVDEARAFRETIAARQVNLYQMSVCIRNTVKYHFVTPKMYMPGLDYVVNEILKLVTEKLKVGVINFVTYEQIGAIKDSPRLRNVLIHLIQEPKEINKLETPLFDVFFCLNAQELPQDIYEYYLVEYVGKYAVLTKTAEYYETEYAPNDIPAHQVAKETTAVTKH